MCNILLYCHQLRGLGHVAHTMYLSQALAKIESFSVAVVTGSSVPITVPRGVRLISLPPVKEPLHRPEIIEIIKRRATQILTFCRSWRPSFLLVDHLAAGLGAELLPILNAAENERWKTRFVLGVRYIEGMPVDVPRNPHVARAYSKYSIAVGYNDQAFEPILENLSAFRGIQCRKYVGVAAPAPSAPVPRDVSDRRKRVVVICGGGFYQTPRFFDQVLNACRTLLLNREIRLTFITGPLSEPIVTERHRDVLEAVDIQPSGPAEDWAGRAEVIVARCGYNTAFTVIQSPVPVVFVPVPGQRSEQINRARKLARLNGVWNVEENGTSSESRLSDVIRAALATPLKPRRLPFTTDASGRLPAFFQDMSQNKGSSDWN